MTEFSQEFLEKTRKTWQKYSPTPLTLEDAREITENMTSFVKILLEWERKDKETA